MLTEKIQAIIEKSYQNEKLKRIDPKDIILENQTEVKELINIFSNQYKELKTEDTFLNEEVLEKDLQFDG